VIVAWWKTLTRCVGIPSQLCRRFDRQSGEVPKASGEWEREILRQRSDFEVRGRLGDRRLRLERRRKVALGVDATRTAELDELVGEQFREPSRLADDRHKKLFLKAVQLRR
jgi:hypothetical protein